MKRWDWVWIVATVLALLGLIEISMLVGAICPSCPLWFLG